MNAVGYNLTSDHVQRWCFLCLFQSTRVHIFQATAQAFKWHKNEPPESAFWFGPVPTGHVGTGAILAPGFGTQPYYLPSPNASMASVFFSLAWSIISSVTWKSRKQLECRLECLLKSHGTRSGVRHSFSAVHSVPMGFFMHYWCWQPIPKPYEQRFSSMASPPGFQSLPSPGVHLCLVQSPHHRQSLSDKSGVLGINKCLEHVVWIMSEFEIS